MTPCRVWHEQRRDGKPRAKPRIGKLPDRVYHGADLEPSENRWCVGQGFECISSATDGRHDRNSD
jgi:hypothetical protein